MSDFLFCESPLYIGIEDSQRFVVGVLRQLLYVSIDLLEVFDFAVGLLHMIVVLIFPIVVLPSDVVEKILIVCVGQLVVAPAFFVGAGE